VCGVHSACVRVCVYSVLVRVNSVSVMHAHSYAFDAAWLRATFAASPLLGVRFTRFVAGERLCVREVSH
jgi:hypothetical protein